jgi:hypothetical protein
MRQLDIVCATWNLESQVPSLKPLADFKQALLKNGGLPDFAVIGLQEAKPSEDRFVAQSCLNSFAFEWEKQPTMQAVQSGGQVVQGPQIHGVTDPSQVKATTDLAQQGCYQHIGIMRRSNSPWDVLQVKEETKWKPGLASEKGAVALVVDIEHNIDKECLRLVFVSTHLDAAKGQAEELTEYFTWLNGLTRAGSIQRKGAPFEAKNLANIRFIMGDLNFRLFPNPAPKNQGLPGGNDTSDTWADALLNPQMRDLLFTDYDGLENAKDPDNSTEKLVPEGWSFPKPKTNDGAGPKVCFPTYKRYWEGAEQATGYVNSIRKGAPGAQAARDAIKGLYGLTDKLDFDKKRDAWNIGWLDRIGYITDAGHNILQFKDPVVFCWDCFDMVHSDHTPVFLRLSAKVVY